MRKFCVMRRERGVEELVHEVVTNQEAVVTQSGALATWNPAHSTGRIPKKTFIVRDTYTEETVDWNFSMCNPMDPKTFDRLFRDTQKKLGALNRVYMTERTIGADTTYALPVRVTADRALTALFTHNMFLPCIGAEWNEATGAGFELLVLSNDTHQCVAMDFHRKRGVIIGTSYLGCAKKLMFTVMNYLLPARGVLPLHCSAVEDERGDTHLFLGLSGTGKTTLSSDPRRKLIGDDEHFWSDHGIANMENGCYAKLINLNAEKEPEIYEAVFEATSPTGGGLRRGAVIIENAMVYPDGSVDLNDSRLTENSRASYPLTSLKNIKKEKCGGHPKSIVFLTADANGVLPPIAKLNTNQAMLWFLMGYTSKLAGTETGVTTPQSTFSRFFGGPFMPYRPQVYLDLFREKILKHGTHVFLVNTGWGGGAYPHATRMDIILTRQLVDAALSGELNTVSCEEDKRFHFGIPKECPKYTWEGPATYEKAADALAQEFARAFEKEFAGKVSQEIAACCPGH
ncbi:phosphoenolpyruvate carboxykinase (ATP) [Candidatus Peregrinibacteria bacterium]|nr:phosphoenolpyruvate carboxykinase (ATP) [Candidatus Peregrinibacteria bacterium]